MDILYGILIVFLWFGVVLLMRLLTTFLHESGHALPALLFTQGPVSVFVGSYGDQDGSWTFNLGRLTYYFRARFFDWNLGLCRHRAESLTFGQSVMILLGGPLASVIVATIAFFLLWRTENEMVFVVVSAFLLSAVWDLIINLLPRSGSMSLHEGGALSSDGAQLLQLIARRRLPAAYLAIEKAYAKKAYPQVVELAERQIESGAAIAPTFRLAINAYREMGEYGGALAVYESYQKNHPLRPEDFLLIGELYDRFGNYREAIACYAEYLHFNYSDIEALYAKGRAYQEMGEHERAAIDLSVVLDRAPLHQQARLDRALSLVRLNELEAAGEELRRAEQLLDEHPKYYRILGFYREAIQDLAGAHSAFSRAKELGDDYHGIEFKLSELERYL